MSTLKVTHLQNENGTGPAMSIAVGGGVTFAGITTFHGNVDLGSNSLEGSLQVATGATISGSTNTITASTNGEERLRIDSSGDIEIAQGKNLTWVYQGGSTHRARIRAESTDALIFENGSGNTEQLRITSAGNVGINTNAPDKLLTVFTDSNSGYSTATNNTPSGQSLIKLFNKNGTDNTGVDNYSAIEFGVANGATSQGWLGYTRTGNNQGAFFMKQRNAASSYPETIRFPSSGGVTFGGGANDANTLDDYEEGTWSPEIKGWNGSYTTAEGAYIKIGRQVFISGEVITNASTGTSVHTWPGLSNLPFVNTTSFHSGGSQRHMGTATLLGDVSPNNSGMAFLTFDRTDGTSFFPNHISPVGASNFQNTMINNITTVNFGMRFNCTYFTD